MDEEFKESERVETKKETDKKCPMCGGIMDFDPKVGMLHCPYCDYTEEIAAEEIEGETSAQEQDFLSAEKTGNCDWGVATKTVQCKSCGGEMVYDAMQTAGECPYCGSNQVMEAATQDTLAPGGVCTFNIDVKTAASNFQKWISKKWFVPNACKTSAKANEIHGIYLPYWTFDSQTVSEYSGEYGIESQKKDSNGNTTTTTDWYNCSGTYERFIDDEPVCGTKRYDASLLGGILPFDTANNKNYKPEYVAGFTSERYSIGLKDAWEKAKRIISGKIKSGITQKIKEEKHADDVRNLRIKTTYNEIKYKYLLLPVWMSHFNYNGKVYNFMVNGQNGKVSGHAPLSAAKVAIAVLIGIAAAGLLWFLCSM